MAFPVIHGTFYIVNHPFFLGGGRERVGAFVELHDTNLVLNQHDQILFIWVNYDIYIYK